MAGVLPLSAILRNSGILKHVPRREDQRTYSDTVFGVSFSYPRDYSPDAERLPGGETEVVFSDAQSQSFYLLLRPNPDHFTLRHFYEIRAVETGYDPFLLAGEIDQVDLPSGTATEFSNLPDNTPQLIIATSLKNVIVEFYPNGLDQAAISALLRSLTLDK